MIFLRFWSVNRGLPPQQTPAEAATAEAQKPSGMPPKKNTSSSAVQLIKKQTE